MPGTAVAAVAHFYSILKRCAGNQLAAAEHVHQRICAAGVAVEHQRAAIRAGLDTDRIDRPGRRVGNDRRAAREHQPWLAGTRLRWIARLEQRLLIAFDIGYQAE